MKKDQFVVKRNDGWAVKTANSKRATRIVSTQKEAIEIAETAAKKNKSEMRVQGRDGKFRLCNSYGNDPYPPRDKNF